MFNKKFVITAFPRTGSTLVRHNLSSYFGVFVEHTHDQLYRPPSDDFTAVVTRRRNVFDCVCSHFVIRGSLIQFLIIQVRYFYDLHKKAADFLYEFHHEIGRNN